MTIWADLNRIFEDHFPSYMDLTKENIDITIFTELEQHIYTCKQWQKKDNIWKGKRRLKNTMNIEFIKNNPDIKFLCGTRDYIERIDKVKPLL